MLLSSLKSIGTQEQDFSADFTAVVYYIEVQTVCSSLPVLQRLYDYLKKNPGVVANTFITSTLEAGISLSQKPKKINKTKQNLGKK